MKISSTSIKGVFELTPNTFADNRGWFTELYKESALAEMGIKTTFVQQNLSYSKKGVVRGLHVQLPPKEQIKWVTVVKGVILDVAVDLRAGSKSFGKHCMVSLNSTTHNMLLIPKGVAHGFRALEDTLLLYLCSGDYDPKYETGIRWNDPKLNIAWDIKNPILSEKDSMLPSLAELQQQAIIPLAGDEPPA